jgi:hypothetical protein
MAGGGTAAGSGHFVCRGTPVAYADAYTDADADANWSYTHQHGHTHGDPHSDAAGTTHYRGQRLFLL